MYTLNQVLGQLYFFKGVLIDRSYRLDKDLTIIGNNMTQEHEILADEMIREVATEVYSRKVNQYGDLFVKVPGELWKFYPTYLPNSTKYCYRS